MSEMSSDHHKIALEISTLGFSSSATWIITAATSRHHALPDAFVATAVCRCSVWWALSGTRKVFPCCVVDFYPLAECQGAVDAETVAGAAVVGPRNTTSQRASCPSQLFLRRGDAVLPCGSVAA